MPLNVPKRYTPTVPRMWTCAICGKEFASTQANAKFCSRPCRVKGAAYRSGTGIADDLPLSGSSRIGAYAEMLVAVDLMAKGFDPYRNLTISAMPDLLVLAPNRADILRVEVTAGRRKPDGSLFFSRHDPSSGLWDVIAVVHVDGIEYFGNDLEPFSMDEYLSAH